MNLKNIIRLLLSFSVIVLTYCTASKPGDPSGNLPGDDDNLYLITNDGDLNHLSADTIDAEYNTFFFTSNESYRKFYLGGKLPDDGINYNSIRLTDANIYLSPGKIVSFGTSDIDNSYYSIPIEATDIPTVSFGSVDYDINLEVGVEDVTANPQTFVPKRTDKIKFKVGASDYRDWGLNVYQQIDYTSLDLTKNNIVSAFENMNVSFGNNSYRIENLNSSLPNARVNLEFNDHTSPDDPVAQYVFQILYPTLSTLQAMVQYYADNPDEGLLFYVEDYNPLHQTNNDIIWGYTLTDPAINEVLKYAPISMIYIKRIRDNFNPTWIDKMISYTTVHELAHQWCEGITNPAHSQWHNGNNKNF